MTRLATNTRLRIPDDPTSPPPLTTTPHRKTSSQRGTEERHYGKLGETTYEKKTLVTFTDPTHPQVGASVVARVPVVLIGRSVS